MKKRVMALLLMTILAGGGLATQALSFGAGGGQGPRGDGERGPERRLEMMAAVLDLTESQQEQIRVIHEAERETMKPYRQQVHQAREQMRELTRSSSFDEAQVRFLAAQISAAQVEMTVARAKIHNQVYNLLTPEQQTLAKKLEPLVGKRHKRHG